MEKDYTVRDVIDMAVQAKQRGVELYLALAKNSENYHVGKLFTELAKDEKRHKIKLSKKLQDIADTDPGEAYPGERSLYLKALVDSNAFVCDKTQETVLKTTIKEEDALHAGITFEKDFMLFLHDIKQNVSDEAKEMIDLILEEEVKHLGDFFHLKENLRKAS